jgi:hypothetical protein
MPKLGTHKASEFTAVSTAPSINKTQVGSSVVPLPYPTTQDLGRSVGVVPTVRFRGTPVYVLDQSTQPSCTGDSAGSLKGVKSGTVNGEVKPTSASGSVRAGGKYVVRVGDTNTMNGGNNPGLYVAAPAPSGMSAKAASAGADQPPDRNATPAEQTFMDKVKRVAKDLAQGYKDNVSPSLHDAAGKAMDVGGKVAGAGGVTMLAGTGVAATGVGLPVAAGMEAVGGAGVTVGGAVGAVGGATDAGASTMDAAADWILTGKAPDFVSAAVGIVENAVINRITSMIPGSKAVVAEAKALKTEAKAEAHAVKNEVKQEEKQIEKAAQDQVASGIGNNVNVPGRGDDDSPCGIKPYKDQKCPKGQQAHHIVPDYTLRYGARGDGESRIPGMPSLEDGPSICLSGGSKTPGSEHNLAHEGTDPRIAAVGRDLEKGPNGVAPIGELMDISIEEVSKIKPHCGEEVRRKVRDAFKGVDPNRYGRTTQSLPDNEARATMARGESHTTTTPRRGRRR